MRFNLNKFSSLKINKIGNVVDYRRGCKTTKKHVLEWKLMLDKQT